MTQNKTQNQKHKKIATPEPTGKLNVETESKPFYGLFYMVDEARTPSEIKSLKELGLSRESVERFYQERYGWATLSDGLEKSTKQAKKICNILHCGMIVTQNKLRIEYIWQSETHKTVDTYVTIDRQDLIED